MSLRFEAAKEQYDAELKKVRKQLFGVTPENFHRMAIEDCIQHYERMAVKMAVQDDDENLREMFNEVVRVINFELEKLNNA